MNISIYKNEIKRSICNRWMIIAIIVSAAFGIAGFLYTLNGKIEYNAMLVQMGQEKMQYITNDTAYTKWMFFDDSNFVRYIYLFVMPILVVIPYATSYYSDCRSGYIKQLVTRVPSKCYYRAKYIANFISAALIFFTPAFINFVMTSWIYPIHNPSPLVAGLHEYNLFYNLFYDIPYVYVIGCMVYYCIISGLLASIAILVSKYIENYFSIIITPFVLAFVAMYIDRILNGGYFGLMVIINGKVMKEFYIPLIMLGIIFVITYIPFVYDKKEVV